MRTLRACSLDVCGPPRPNHRCCLPHPRAALPQDFGPKEAPYALVRPKNAFEPNTAPFDGEAARVCALRVRGATWAMGAWSGSGGLLSYLGLPAQHSAFWLVGLCGPWVPGAGAGGLLRVLKPIGLWGAQPQLSPATRVRPQLQARCLLHGWSRRLCC